MKLPILTFHAIDDWQSVISFSRSQFQRSLARLHRKGFRTFDLLRTGAFR